MLALSKQVVLITGASSGIGAALAETLAQRYPEIRLVLAARNVSQIESVAALCRQFGASVLVVRTDLEQLEQVENLAKSAIAHFEKVDTLVNNQSYDQIGVLELIPNTAERQFPTNVFGPLALIRAIIPGMRNSGGGRIINVSSLGGKITFPFGGLYSASKFALEAISDALRMELEPFNIKVSVIQPGAVSTNFFAVAARAVAENIVSPESTPYRSAFTKLKGLEQRTKRTAWTQERVAAVIIHALSQKNPRPRYIAATGGSFLVFLMTKVLPTKWVDRFWQHFYGINLVAQEWHINQNQELGH